jgi:uncharacterized protein YraI
MTLLMLAVTFVFLVICGLPVQAMSRAVPQAQATLTPQATVYPAGKAGTVRAARLNVRTGASTSQRQIGVLQRGARVQVLQRQGDWLQIVFKNGPGGKGWVSANHVAVDGEPTPVAPAAAQTPTSGQAGTAPRVATPNAVSYRDPTFSWEWGGLNQVTGTPWYFDILFFTRSGADPYDVVSVTLSQVRQENGSWKYDHRYTARCDSYWVVQIAKGAPANFQGWISDRSNRQPIGEPCPAPTPDCQDCGG